MLPARKGRIQEYTAMSVLGQCRNETDRDRENRRERVKLPARKGRIQEYTAISVLGQCRNDGVGADLLRLQGTGVPFIQGLHLQVSNSRQ